jgi:hypothetical protein
VSVSSYIFSNGRYYDREGRPMGETPDCIRVAGTLSASGLVVAGAVGLKIRVIGFFLNALAATAVKFQSNSTDISGTLSLAANGGAVVPPAPLGWFETVAGEALNLNISVATTVGVQVLYVLVA